MPVGLGDMQGVALQPTPDVFTANIDVQHLPVATDSISQPKLNEKPLHLASLVAPSDVQTKQLLRHSLPLTETGNGSSVVEGMPCVETDTVHEVHNEMPLQALGDPLVQLHDT